jgi:hypothetical protein
MRRLISIALLALIGGAAYADLVATTRLGRPAPVAQAVCTAC